MQFALGHTVDGKQVDPHMAHKGLDEIILAHGGVQPFHLRKIAGMVGGVGIMHQTVALGELLSEDGEQAVVVGAGNG